MLQRTVTETGNVYYHFLEHPLWAAYEAIVAAFVRPERLRRLR